MARGNLPVPSSDLWDLVLDMDWPRVVQHAKSQPQDADFLEGHWHETPLYLACQHDPPLEALQAVIQAHPKSVQIASTQNRDLPIHIACRYQAGTDVLEALLQHYPKTATGTTKWGWTPLLTLWESCKEEKEENDDFWEKVLVLLRAVARSRLIAINPFDDICCTKVNGVVSKNPKDPSSVSLSNQQEDIFFVHAAASVGARGCPIEVLSFVMEKYPKQVFQRDEKGHLPLHVLLEKVTWSKHRKRRLKPKEKPFVESLLHAYPGSGRERNISDHRRYPLHSAIANGHTWSQGVREIFLAAPECIIVRDPYTGLYPFLLAAVPIVEEKSYGVDNVETVYQLLRARPDVIFSIQEDSKQKEKPKIYARKGRTKRMLYEERPRKHILFDSLGGRFIWDAGMPHLDGFFRVRKLVYKTRR